MATISDLFLDLLRQDQHWLIRQPGMNGWDRGCRQLLATMEAWLLDDSKLLCETPVTLGHSGYERFIKRQWGCWRFHWRKAADGQPVHGRTVAEALRAGISPLSGAKLHGNALQDVVWVEAMLQGDNRAIHLFLKQFQPQVEMWAREIRFSLASDLAWWQDLSAKLVGVPTQVGKLASFVGKSALQPWLETTVKRELIRQSQRRAKESDVRLILQRNAAEASLVTPAGDAISAECSELLSSVLKAILDDSSRNERNAIRLLLVEGLSRVEVSEFLRIDKGNVTRAVQRFVQRVQECLGLADAGTKAGYERYGPCLEHVFESGDRGAVRALLARVVSDLDDLELPR